MCQIATVHYCRACMRAWNLTSPRTDAPLLIPSDALIGRGDGMQVAVVRQDHRVHLQKIEVGRDFGDRLEVAGGLSEGDLVIANPGDAVREGLEVQSVPVVEVSKIISRYHWAICQTRCLAGRQLPAAGTLDPGVQDVHVNDIGVAVPEIHAAFHQGGVPINPHAGV